METVWGDIRHGLRMLWKSPGFTAVAVITLALGIGANSAIFSVVNAFLLRPLPVKDPQQLVVVANSHPENEDPHNISYLDYQDYQAQSDAFTDMSAANLSFMGLSADGKAERTFAYLVSGNYFSMLGIEPALGRFILPTEGKTPGTDPVVVLGYKYWRRRFGGDPSVVGKVVSVNGHPCTIIGVAPESFHGTFSLAETEIYMPLGMAAIDPEANDLFTKRTAHALRILARLKPGISRQAAQASLQVIATRLAKEYPDSNKGNRMYVIPENLARPDANSSAQVPLVASVFLGLVGMVLLVACLNVVNLLLSRATVRSKEIAIRAALGAARARIIRQMLTESILLGLLGGGLGAVAGWWASRMLAGIRLPGDLPFHFDFGMDWRVFGYSLGIALLAGLVSGLIPALRGSMANVHDTLREGGRGPGGDTHHRLRDALVVAQVAGSLVLLVAAGLFVRSVGNARSVKLGFQPDHVLLVSMDVAERGYDAARGRAFYRELESRIRALPGVRSATVSFTFPLNYDNQSAYIRAEGQPPDPTKRGPIAGFNDVGTDYFETVGTPVIRGRELTAEDQESPVRVAVVNETMAKKLWPNEDPVGKRFIADNANDKPIEVVGITGNGKYQWIFEDPTPFYYAPIGQNYHSVRVLQVRTEGAPESLALTVVKQIHDLDPNLPVYDVMGMHQALDGGNGFFLLNMGADFAGALGALGLVLALVGVYGVVSYAASRRTHEIGIRMALGAGRPNILKMVLARGFGLVLAGIATGVAVALVLTRFMANLLFGIRPADPVTFGGVALVLALVSLLACYIPARRATLVDPLVALRHE